MAFSQKFLALLLAVSTVAFAVATSIDSRGEVVKKKGLIRSAKDNARMGGALEASDMSEPSATVDVGAHGSIKVAKKSKDFRSTMKKQREVHVCDQCNDCTRSEEDGETCFCRTKKEFEIMEQLGRYAVADSLASGTTEFDDYCGKPKYTDAAGDEKDGGCKYLVYAGNDEHANPIKVQRGDQAGTACMSETPCVCDNIFNWCMDGEVYDWADCNTKTGAKTCKEATEHCDNHADADADVRASHQAHRATQQAAMRNAQREAKQNVTGEACEDNEGGLSAWLAAQTVPLPASTCDQEKEIDPACNGAWAGYCQLTCGNCHVSVPTAITGAATVSTATAATATISHEDGGR